MADIEKLLSAIDWAEENAYGADGDLSSDRAYSIQLYLGENTEPAPTGRSQIVDRSVFETIQWIMPSLCRIFANGSDLVSIPPVGPEDEEAAKQEAEYLNHVITQQNPWFEIFQTWATDALTTRNAYAMAYTDKRRQVDLERYERQTEEGVALLLQDKDIEVVSSKQYPDPDFEPVPLAGPDGQPLIGPDGQPVMQPPAMLYDLDIRRTGEQRKICIKVLPPERCRVSQYTPTYRLKDTDYFEYWDYQTISQLRAAGFEVPDDIASEIEETEEDDARDIYTESRDDNKADPSMRRIKARMIWIRHDLDGDGIAELLYCVRIGTTKNLVHMEETSSIPVACIVPSPLPHRHMGLSITDMVADIQRTKTAIIRQGLDNLYLSNNPQKVVNDHLVNLDDVLQNVPGGVIRSEDVNAIRYEKHPFVFPEALAGLEYMDTVRENRAGVSRYFSGTDQNALNKTATGIQTLSTMAAQRVEQIARIIGSGVEDLARVVHELILRGGHRQEVTKIRGQWIEVDPGTWRSRNDFRIAVGFASGNKDAMVGRLQMIGMQQLQAMQMGLPVVQPENYYETMMELTKASDFSNPDRFWTDPSTAEPQPQQPNPDMLRLQGEMTAKEAELGMTAETKQAELALKEQEMAQKAVLEKYRIDTDAQTKIQLAAMQSESAKELETHRANTVVAKQDRMKIENLDKLDTVVESTQAVAEASAAQAQMLAESLVAVVQMLSQAVEKLGAPKVPIRDKTGRIVRVESAQ